MNSFWLQDASDWLYSLAKHCTRGEIYTSAIFLIRSTYKSSVDSAGSMKQELCVDAPAAVALWLQKKVNHHWQSK